jgi:murein peptide amidase A
MRVGTQLAPPVGLARVGTSLALGIALTFAIASAVPARAAATDTTSTTTASPAAETSPSLDATPVAAEVVTRTIGYSVRGRRIVLERFGSGPRRVLIVAGMHGDEAGGLLAARFKSYLRADPSAIPEGTRVDVIAYANPDGRALDRRTNARKVDLNRNFPASNWTHRHPRGTASHGRRPGSEPETKALVAVLERGQYVRVIALHSRGGFVDPDGAGSRALAKRMAGAAHIPVVNLPAYNGSMGTYVPEKYGVPMVTWELNSRRLSPPVRAGLLEGLR